jgi:hypothetical protein
VSGGVITEQHQHYEVLGQPVRPFGPIQEADPLVGRICPACRTPLAAGQIPCLLVMDSEYNRQAAAEARGAYTAEATPAHWTCVTGSTDPVGDYERYFGFEASA